MGTETSIPAYCARTSHFFDSLPRPKLKPTNALAKVVPLVLLKAESAKVSNANALSEIRRKREIQYRLETSSTEYYVAETDYWKWRVAEPLE